MSMPSHERPASDMVGQLAELLGIPWDTASESPEKVRVHDFGLVSLGQDFTGELPDESGGVGSVEVSQMVNEANRELLTATEMNDAKRQRIIAKTIRWLQFLEQRSQSLTENVYALVNRLASDSRLSWLTSDRDRVGETTERLEWAFTAITRWMERRLPLAQRRESGARLSVDWTVAGARTWWAEGQAAEPFLLRDLVRECLLLDGQFPAEHAEPIADRILEDLRHGKLWLPRLTRREESTADLTVLSYETLTSRAQPPLVSRKDEVDDESASAEQRGYLDSMALDEAENELEFTEMMPELAAAYDRSIAEEYLFVPTVGEIAARGGRMGGISLDIRKRGAMDFLTCSVSGQVPLGYKLVEGGFVRPGTAVTRDVAAALSAELAGRYHRRPRHVARRLRNIARVKFRTATGQGDFAAAQRYLDAITGIQQFMAEQDR